MTAKIEKSGTPATSPVVFVVDDDALMRGALSSLIRSAGLSVTVFASAKEFLAQKTPAVPACLVLDVYLPDMNGIELHQELIQKHNNIPVIFITGHGDIPMSVRAMKAGAAEFLPKPFRDEDLLEAIQQALRRDAQAIEHRSQLAKLQSRYELLTAREREVMGLVIRGLLNKQIASQLDAAEITVKVRRAQVMQKMQAESLADLILMAGRLGLVS